MSRVIIPGYAKRAAMLGLIQRKTNRAGLTKKEASSLGISSGVERAKQLIRNKYLSEDDAKAVARFYNRFKNCRTERCETAIRLWGGRRFGDLLNNTFYESK